MPQFRNWKNNIFPPIDTLNKYLFDCKKIKFLLTVTLKKISLIARKLKKHISPDWHFKKD